MTTISSPRASTPNIKSPATSSAPSARSSISVDRPLPAQSSTRRNRTALRDYYNLSAATSSTANNESSQAAPTPVPEHEVSKFDRADFNAESYVEALFKDEGLATIMKVESDLLSDIRSLDGEKKALVYDNYSKLIDATETIGRVRKMLDVEALTGQKRDDPDDAIKKLTEGDIPESVEGKGKLDELVDRVVEIASRRQAGLERGEAAPKGDVEDRAPADDRGKQKETVGMVLATPHRIEAALKDGRREDAEADWNDVKALLGGFKNITGIEELRSRCEELLAR